MTTREMPVLRAYASFLWTPRGRAPAAAEVAVQLAVALDSNGVVSVTAPPPLGSLVTGLRWVDAGSVDASHGMWAANAWNDEQKRDLVRSAVDALKKQMQRRAAE